MGLTGLVPLLVLGLGLVTVIAATLALWNMVPNLLAWPVRLGCLVMLMVLTLGVTADAVNRDYGFYSSWRDLIDSPTDTRLTAAAALRHQRLPSADLARGAEAAAHGHGTLVKWMFPGARSGIIRTGLVYLPAAYFDKAKPGQRFGVIELLHGYAGSPGNWSHALQIADTLDAEIAAGRLPPVIAVAPKTYDTHDGECVDAVHGQRNDTYLGVDVPADTDTVFRTDTAPGSWATLGFSTGGFCAVNLALHHPGTFRAAVSLSGYFTAITDRTTGDLYRGEKNARLENSPVWWVRHHPVRTALYVFASGGDHYAFAQVAPFRRAVPTGTDLTTVTVRVGGHNATVWRAAMPPALDWLGQRLPGPTRPAQTERGSKVQG
jgi:enterochelin esterase-like enzyme